MENLNKNNKKIWISLIVIALGIFSLIGYKSVFNSKLVQGEKEYTLIVRDTENTFNSKYELKTEEMVLGKDLDNRGIIETDDSGASRFVTGVNGKVANASKQEWWNLKINGENSTTGIDDTAINDGDEIELILTTGW